MSRAPSPHMLLALQAGLVSQELLGALTAVDDDLCSACLFAEYWDTHSDRDAWLRQNLSSQFYSLAVLLHQWCCEQSASWARGAVHIPVFRSPASCKPTAPSSFITTGGNGSKRRYAAISSGGRHRPRQSSSEPPVGPLLSKAAREQEEYQQVLEVTLNLIASLGHLLGLTQELNSSTLCSVGQVSRKIVSTTAPSAGTLRAHNLSFKRFLLWVPTENFHRASVLSKLPISTLPISWKSWQPSVLRCQNPQHRVWLGGSNSWMCLLHFH